MSPVTEQASSRAVAPVDARPLLMARVGYITAAVVFGVFLITAIVMPHANAGAHFGVKDQIGTGVLGVLVGGAFLLLARPRLHADLDGVRMRSFAGNYRVVPWDVIVRVEFPAKSRFARVVLPGEEYLALYAVQRVDREQAVAVMRGLRALFAAAHPEA